MNELAKQLFKVFKEEIHPAVLRFHSSGFKTENYQVFYSRVKNDLFFDLLGYDYNIRFYEIEPKKFLFFKRLSQIGKLTLKPNGKIKNKNITVEILIEALNYAKSKWVKMEIDDSEFKK